MHAYRKNVGAAAAIVALMILSTLSGLAASAPPALAHSAPSAATPTPAATAASPSLSLSAISSALPSGGAVTLPAGTDANMNSLRVPSAPAGASPTSSVSGNRMASTVSTLQADGVPLRDAFLPDLSANPNPTLSPYGTVIPTYTAGGPAPIGVAEYGISNDSGTLVPENLSTTLLIGGFVGSNELCYEIGNCTPSVLAMDSGTPDAYGLQLNAVLENVTLFNTPGYDFWTQNVVEYSTYSHQLYLITNIWNFSSPAQDFTPNSLVEHGANGTIVPGELYYSVAGPFNISANYEGIVVLTSELIGNDDAVVFEYDFFNGTASYTGLNDFAVFNSTGAAGPGVDAPALYVASGSQYTPLGIPADWEFVMGGPGGGSNLDVLSMYSTMDLYYLNPFTGEIAAVPSAYDIGSETGETSVGATALWQGNWSPFFGSGPGEYLATGPLFVSGMWNVTNSTQGFAVFGNLFQPSNGFTFLGQTTIANDYQVFSWAPPDWVYFLPPATYTAWWLASNYDPTSAGFTLTNGSEEIFSIGLTYDSFAGVYTPLWALNQSGLENITWNGYTLYDNEYGPIGYDPAGGYYFPWFGEFNDFTYPVFAGILLWHVFDAQIIAPPALTVDYPSWNLPYLDYFGLPTTNSLPILVYDSYFVDLAGASAITGWWFTAADFGPTVPQYSVVFWNTSYSAIGNNLFATGSNALYLYGGTDNEIFNNTFLQYLPNAPDPLAISGAYFGTYALFEADYGDFVFGGDYCDCHDLVYNNVFDTYFTAYSPYYDPYTGGFPIYPFSEEWNVPKTPGLNIIGGDYLGGNYWWNYGTSQDPYGYLPYDNFAVDYLFIWGLDPYGIAWGGDYLPLTPTPVYTITFVETGLPAGTVWSPAVEASDGGYAYNYTNGNETNESWVAGVYYLNATTESRWYRFSGIPSSLVVTGNETVYLAFVPLYAVSFHETGLPSGTAWEAYLEGGLYFYNNGTDTAWVNVTVPAGSYYYDVYAFAYFGAPSGFGDLTVTGNTTVNVAFDPVFSVAFNESGLPSGYDWSIIIHSIGPDGNASIGTNASSEFLGYAFAGWTYSWWVSAPDYVATPSSGSFDLEENTTVFVTFAASESITFDEIGLASGAAWTVQFTQGSSTTTETSTGPSMTFAGMAGAYSYTVSAAGYVPLSSSGSGTLPAAEPVDVTFSAAPATIVFDATGLAVGTDWTVKFTQGGTTTSHSGTGSITIDAVYGAYNYSVSASEYTATPATGAGVLPSDTPVMTSFAPTAASLEFDESGLPVGASWEVEFTQGGVTTGYTGTGTITVNAVDGAYSYAEVKAANYSATPSSGAGALPGDSSVSVVFAQVDGTLSGTIAPGHATLTVGGHVESLGAGGTFTVDLAPGTYAVKVNASGYYSYYTNTTVSSGKTTELNVKLQAIPASPTKPLLGVSGSSGWLVIAGLAILALVLLGTTLLFMRRSRRPPQMAQYTEPAAPKGATGGAAGAPDWSESGTGSPPPGKN
ncbi:MAG: thermopsin family protease [Thermoplasmata archaeon]